MDDDKLDVDILRHLEDLSNKINRVMAENTKTVFQRYPVTFALLALLGFVAVSEGVKGILEMFSLTSHPWYMLIVGLFILITTGQLYKKLDK